PPPRRWSAALREPPAGVHRYGDEMRPTPLLLGFALFAAACGGGASEPTSVSSPPATTASSSAPSAPLGMATDFEGEAAPDFTLDLQNREGQFVLSESEDPIYLVFWAEW
ncbi:MAG: hypothetical protein OEM22_04380, partial [Acidimicrobiia bacterium]|nr:hypothetical protein [Acidimicrobiia bacterium]